MKVSEITLKEIAQHIHLEEENMSEDDKQYVQLIEDAALSYVKSYTSLTEEQIDAHEDITIAYLVLIGDMYDNRAVYVDKSNENKVVTNILGMHSRNYL